MRSFLDLSPARDQDCLRDGIAEEILTSLTHVEGPRVGPRSSSFQFKSKAVDARTVGARLGVEVVLEGAVRKAGDRLRVTAQLVDVAGGYQRWSHRFDGTVADVFAIQDEIAAKVATLLRGFLGTDARKALRRPGTTAEAYEHFLRGRQLLYKWTAPSLLASEESLQASAAPNARSISTRRTRALSLGPAAWVVLGEPERALEWCRRSVEAAPDDPGALHNAACLHARMGKTDAAFDILDQTLGRGLGKRDWVEHDPDLDSLRDVPRFQALLAKLP